MFEHRHGYQPAADDRPMGPPPSQGSGGQKDIDFVKHLKRLDVRPGDKFVLTIPGMISQDTAARLQEKWRQFIGGDGSDGALLILDGGCEIGVIRKATE